MQPIINFLQSEWPFIIGCAFLSIYSAQAAASRHLYFKVAVALGFSAYFIYGQSIFDWFSSLDSDSLTEVTGDISVRETYFFISTLPSLFFPKPFGLKFFIFYSLWLASVYLIAKQILSKNRRWMAGFVHVCNVLLLAASAIIIYEANERIQHNSHALSELRKSLSSAKSTYKKVESHPKIVIYVGESTSSYHMSLYGYPRGTTPELKYLAGSDEGFIVFRNVYSRHTHTTASLIDAFSYPKKSVSGQTAARGNVFEVLTSAGFTTKLHSNQGRSGSWNWGGQILFENFGERHYESEKASVGNIVSPTLKIYDHQLMSLALQGGLKDVTVLHSYSGHGNYLENIPPNFRKRLDDNISHIKQNGIVGEKFDGLLEDVSTVIEDYDTAIRYVSYSVASSIALISKNHDPVVFLYFSDHGESPFTNAGHDSSRFIDEMARVPVLVYFNSAAREQFGALYKKYKNAARVDGARTLAQISATLLDLSRLTVDDITVSPLTEGQNSGDFTIVNRSVAIDIGTGSIDTNFDPSTKTVFPTYLNLSRLGNTEKPICYHRSNTYAKAVRGAFVTNCLEVDIHLDKNGKFQVNHPPAKPANFLLEDIARIANSRKSKVWLDFKNGDLATNCQSLQEKLKSTFERPADLLIEMPPSANQPDSELAMCIRQLQAQGIKVSYYVPTDALVQCADGLQAAEKPFLSTSPACVELKRTLGRVISEGLYKDVSFDVRGLKAMLLSGASQTVKMHTWGLNLRDLKNPAYANFGYVIVNSNTDPNGR